MPTRTAVAGLCIDRSTDMKPPPLAYQVPNWFPNDITAYPDYSSLAYQTLSAPRRCASSKPWLTAIQLSILLVNAQNDPFLPPDTLAGHLNCLVVSHVETRGWWSGLGRKSGCLAAKAAPTIALCFSVTIY